MSSLNQQSGQIDAKDAFVQLAAASDAFERYANPHATRISAIAGEIARRFQMAKQDRASLQTAALLHDLGEVAMERDYIQRKGSLIDDERIDLARHPVIGEKEAARAGADRPAQLLVRWHHEWWNGSGYPDALSREQIPLAARILRVADSYASFTDSRPFRPALIAEHAKNEIVRRAGIEFDPAVVEVLVNLDEIPELRSYAPMDPISLWDS
jgi:HD-GYP domain-containing protein (c-di-GMP phosphodiesterase class II)